MCEAGERADDLGQVTALVLAGGLGTRLRPVVADRPKALVEVGGRPFVTLLLDQLAAAGVRDVILCTGYRGEQVRASLGERYASLRLGYSQEPEPLGTAGALRLALPYVRSGVALVLNGDSYCQADLRAFWGWHQARRAAASLLLTQVADTRRYGRVERNSQDVVTAFVEKSAAGGPGWISAGIYWLSRQLLAENSGRRRRLNRARRVPGLDRARALWLPGRGALSRFRHARGTG